MTASGSEGMGGAGAATEALRGRRVLVVEDEAIVAMLVEDILLDLGAEVMGPAAKVSHALELLGKAAPDVALLDVNLGGETTAPVAEALRARGVPFAFATGYGAAGLPSGFADAPVIQKPFQETDMIRVLAGTLAAPAGD